MNTKNMWKYDHITNFFVFFFVVLFTRVSVVVTDGDGEKEIKRNAFPYMAFIYYLDETIVDSSGLRFMQAAVLIRPDWLITSALDKIEAPLAFPNKTLLARAGAVIIDANFTFNEDDYEQEREVIQIIRPYNYDVKKWWESAVSLLKTLLPFNITSTVSLATVATKHDNVEKSCHIVVFANKYNSSSSEKSLIQATVDILPSSSEKCGDNFVNHSMVCSAETIDTNVLSDDFCNGNNGGPLICENELTALQTYVNDHCKLPYLYHLLTAWDMFIICGLGNSCLDTSCAEVCISLDKDTLEDNNTSITESPKEKLIELLTDDSRDVILIPENPPSIMQTNSVESTSIIPTATFTTKLITETEAITTMSTTTTTEFYKLQEVTTPKLRTTPEKLEEYRRKLNQTTETKEREANVLYMVSTQRVKAKARNSATRKEFKHLTFFAFCATFYLYFI